VRWETEWSFDDKLCQEYSYQKLSKSVNWFSSYSQKCWGCFLRHSVYIGRMYGNINTAGGLNLWDKPAVFLIVLQVIVDLK